MTTLLDSKPFFLLCSLIILLLVSPFIEATQRGDFLITLIFTGILLSLVRLVSDHRNLQIGVGILAGCAVLLLWAGDAFPPNAVWLWGEAFYVCLNILVIIIALTQIVRSTIVDRDVLIGAVAIYLLLGITWALIFSFVHAIDPSSFGDILGSEHSDWNQFVYFSFSTLTTLGYGDIVALSPFARTLSAFEAITGVIFEAMIIARLIGLYRGTQDSPENDAAQ
jgi:hypothetical protein